MYFMGMNLYPAKTQQNNVGQNSVIQLELHRISNLLVMEKHMKRKLTLCYLPSFLVLLLISLLLVSCSIGSQSTPSDFYNARNTDLSVTGAQFDQYTLFRFDTATSAHTLTLPSAADVVANLSNPYAGEVLTLAVTADGNNAVKLIGGTNVTIKPGASTVAGNTTITMYCELDNINSGSEAVTVY
jgi:hypothetical protein